MGIQEHKAQRQRRGLNPAVTPQRRFRASLQPTLVVILFPVLQQTRHQEGVMTGTSL